MASAVLLAIPAAAVDGEILIDQARVNAGDITPGDAPGFPATLRRPGRYKLTGNLRVPAGEDGIVVTQDNVTIDLNGFTISTSPIGPNIRNGVSAVYLRGLRVLNGTITGFLRYAIDNTEGASLVVENMRLVSNYAGVWSGAESRIRNNTIANGTVGIVCHDHCLIERNVVTGNSGDGIHIVAERGGGVVLGNVIVGNGQNGIAAFFEKTGYANNILIGNNGGSAQVLTPAVQMHPNVCEPACP